MGQAITISASAAGLPVAVYDESAVIRERLPDMLGRLADETRHKLVGSVRVARSPLDVVAQASFIVEAVDEDLDLKREVLGRASRANPDATICTNTSVISVTAIGEAIERPERFVGTHWWNPAHLIPIVEVMPGRFTADETVDFACAVLTAIGKTPVRLAQEVAGFIGNRLQVAMWREALALIDRGICEPETIDLIVRQSFGRRLAAVGPCENMQLIGLGLSAAIMHYLLPDLSASGSPPPLLHHMASPPTLGGLPEIDGSARRAIEKRLYDCIGQTSHGASR